MFKGDRASFVHRQASKHYRNLYLKQDSNLFSGTLKNFTVMGTRRVEVKVDIGDRPFKPTIQALMTLVEHHPNVLTTPKPTYQLLSLTEREKTIVALRHWCQAEDYDRVKGELMVSLKEYLS
jgi:small conductance mechanosensitive channel